MSSQNICVSSLTILDHEFHASLIAQLQEKGKAFQKLRVIKMGSPIIHIVMFSQD